uniref:Uncharacterized protein n=1 Tax=Anguilla anguilla TaxID=7936 RepID=A0A0E9PYX4_ANGAN
MQEKHGKLISPLLVFPS